ncbi:hypothetical protein AHAS_Ahas04G0077300 [Arachis hypogaea]
MLLDFSKIIFLISILFFYTLSICIPFESYKKALRNANIIEYLNSIQVLVDYDAILLCIQKILNAHNSPILIYGGFYGEMLAVLFCLKYFYIVLSVLTLSELIFYFNKNK